MKEFSAIVLAAGKGERMRSSLPKVLHTLGGRALIFYVLRELLALKHYIKQIIIVVGDEAEIIEKRVGEELSSLTIKASVRKKLEFVRQKDRRGTAKAVRSAESKVKYKNVLIACADTPLITRRTLSSFIASFLKGYSSCSLLTAYRDDKNDLGRVCRDARGQIKSIKEKIHLDNAQDYREVNSGIYCFKRNILFSNLFKIGKDKEKKEYFLTDIIEFLHREGEKINSYSLNDYEEIMGINTQRELARAEGILRERICAGLMDKGVRIIDPSTTFIDIDTRIGRNTVIYPFTFIERNVIIGANCSLGPFIHLREATRISEGVCLGNFLEVCRSKVGKGAKVKHFGYLGDATLGKMVNIGAGTVVANFDGKKKNKTLIKQGAFIGSDTIFVAPVKIGKEAVTGAGSVVTKNVKPKTVVVGVPAKLLKKIKNKK